MKIGTTTFGFRYLLRDPERAPRLQTVCGQARELGLEVLQICENARPLQVTDDEWCALAEYAAGIGLELQLGCKTLDLRVFERYLARAAALRSRLLRVVLEEDAGEPPSRREIDEFLRGAWRLLEPSGVRLAIENHFEVPSRVLAEAVRAYPPSRVGFCIDTANSLRNFESPQQVMECLGPRALCYHLKDYCVEGDNLGFRVGGAPLGQGKLDLRWFLDQVLSRQEPLDLFVENWVPATGSGKRMSPRTNCGCASRSARCSMRWPPGVSSAPAHRPAIGLSDSISLMLLTMM